MMADKLSTADPSPAAIRRLAVPSWLMSVLLHGAILTTLIVSFPALPRGVLTERGREVGLVLRQDGPEGEEHYLGEESSEASETSTSESAPLSQTSAESSSPQFSDLLNESPPADPSDALPVAAHDAIGAGAVGASTDKALPGLESLTQGTGLNTNPSLGKASTKVFGVPGEGYKFVYVFDRSASMGGNGRSTLSAAKAELIKSLASLGQEHQFQIIFYNESPSILNIAGTNRLVFGTEQNKQLARRFIGGITADGATRHEEALLLALRLKPDVIFFLTDADEPVLGASQLQRIQRLCEGVTTINTIEFGLGPAMADENFLAQLARQNGGHYAYFDISGVGRSK